jgi:hypothetical protein
MNKHIVLKDSEYFHDEEAIIKLESCLDGQVCRKDLSEINKNLLLSRNFVERKEYNRALDVIKEAFDTTYNLKEDHCQKCARFFRETIINSLDRTVADLRKMNKGFFRYRDYSTVLEMAEKMLDAVRGENPGRAI